PLLLLSCFLFHPPPASVIFPLSLHDALPICLVTSCTLFLSACRRFVLRGRPSCNHTLELFEPLTQFGFLSRYLLLLERLEQLERSEEHTSELQSRSDLVCRLLLEKKKDQTHT